MIENYSSVNEKSYRDDDFNYSPNENSSKAAIFENCLPDRIFGESTKY